MEKDHRDARPPRFIKVINLPRLLRASWTTPLSDPTHYNKQLNMHTRHVRIALHLHWMIPELLNLGRLDPEKMETVSNGTVVDDVKREQGKSIGIICDYVDVVMGCKNEPEHVSPQWPWMTLKHFTNLIPGNMSSLRCVVVESIKNTPTVLETFN